MTPVRYVSLGILLALLCVLAATFYQFVAPFMMPLFLAAVLALVSQPLHRRLLARCGGRRAIAAGITTAALIAVVLVPVLIGTVMAASQLVSFVHTYLSQQSLDQSDLWNDAVWPALKPAASWLQYDEVQLKQELSGNADQLARKLAGATLTLASSTVGAFISLTVAVGMFLIALYYFLADGPQLLAAAERLIPVSTEHQRKLGEEFAKATRAVVMATFLAAIAQGIATALALQVLGFGHFFVFLLVATFTALVPVAGTWMVWAPCAVWLAIQGHWGSAVGLALWGVVVVGLLDNVVRTYVLNSDAELHPLLAFISVIGALQVLGLWGIFIGPIVACCLSALVKIIHQELNEVLAEKRVATATATTPPANGGLSSLAPSANVIPQEVQG
jgi:predicted PurR-regulated permease PerM